MRRALFVLLLTGCTNPDEILLVTGSLLSPQPVEGQVVRLLRRFEAYGNQCQPADAVPFKETTADADGHYGFEVFRIEAQNFGGFGGYCFRVDATFPSGAVAWADVDSLLFGTRVAALRDWRAQPRLEDGVLHFEPPVPLPPVLPGGAWQRVTWLSHRMEVVSSDGGVIWKVGDSRLSEDFQTLTREPMVLDAFRLEHFAGSITLEASLAEVEEVPYGLRNAYTSGVWLRAAEHLQVSGTQVPVSRGLPCPDFTSPCALTDGDLTSVDAGFRESFDLELATDRTLSTVVLRGVEATSEFIEVTLLLGDGGVAATTQEPFSRRGFVTDPVTQGSFVQFADGGYGRLRKGFVAISLDAGVPVRKVQLRFPDGLSRIQEISLFE